MFPPLQLILDRLVKTGRLSLIDHLGKLHEFGSGGRPSVTVRLADRALERELALYPQLALGESYTSGRLELLEGDVYELLELLLRHMRPLPRWTEGVDRLRRLTKWFAQYNPPGRARRNVAHHYDIDGSIYELFLDADRQYSCAYFARPEATLEEAQRAKKRHIAAKLHLRGGERILDIGSGWGGLGLYLAECSKGEVLGVTLSREQLDVARERVHQAGLARVVRFELEDYRNVAGTFDRIVSVGMFEHVGVAHYDTYFRKVAELLKEDGVALAHSIGRSDGPTVTNPFIARYIFPGGYIPALSEVLPAIERAGLIVTDIEILRLHYAETLRHWRQRFRANWLRAAALRDEAFCRMWDFYLAGSEAAFRFQNLMVFQIQMTKRVEALPIVRDYMLEDRLEAPGPGQAAHGPMPVAGE